MNELYIYIYIYIIVIVIISYHIISYHLVLFQAGRQTEEGGAALWGGE